MDHWAIIAVLAMQEFPLSIQSRMQEAKIWHQVQACLALWKKYEVRWFFCCGFFRPR